MANIRHPNFILGAFAILVGAVALGLRSTGDYKTASVLMIIAFGIGIIHWIWSIIDVSKTDSIIGGQKVFWLIGVIAIPIGGMFYYFMHSKRDTIVD
jgi:hypothetical protein